jgi:hypothetical protein
MIVDLPMSNSSRRGEMIRGIAIEESFLYEITWLCLIIALTTLGKVRKIRGIHGTKEKTISRLSKLWPAPRSC